MSYTRDAAKEFEDLVRRNMQEHDTSSAQAFANVAREHSELARAYAQRSPEKRSAFAERFPTEHRALAETAAREFEQAVRTYQRQHNCDANTALAETAGRYP